MRIQQPWLVLAVLLFPAAVHADDHRADRFGGFSRSGGSSLFGVHVTDAVTLPNSPKYDLALLGDLSLHFGSHNGNDTARVTFLGGIRWTFAPDATRQPKHLPFVQALLGGVYTHDGVADGTEPAVGLGAGWDYVPARGGAREAWALRAQLDYIISGGEDFSRFSAGVVYRFKR
jgi:hypothetical protein